MINVFFEFDPVPISILIESVLNIISLSIRDREKIPISGYCKAILAKKVVNHKSGLFSNLQISNI